jgi:hypothetical protein
MSIDTYNPPYLSQVVGISAVRGSRGFTVVHKFGRNADVAGAWEPISLGGVYQMPTAAVSLEFLSSDAADALNGAGMHELTVIGLNASWAEQTVSTAAHATDGTTAVAISGTWLRVYRAYVSSSGTYPTSFGGSHVGDITIRVASAGATWATIDEANGGAVDIARGQTEIGCYTVPTGKTAYLSSWTLTVEPGQTTKPSVIIFQRPNADDTSSSYSGTMREIWTAINIDSPINTKPATPLGPFVGPCDIGFVALGAATTAAVECDFELLLLDT